MNNIIVFNQLFFTLLGFYLVLIMIWYVIKGTNSDYLSFEIKYTPLKKVIYQALNTLANLIITSWLFIVWYKVLGTSDFTLNNHSDDSLVNTFVIIAANISVILVLISLKTVKEFLRTIVCYVVLKKDNIPNKLRHALYQKNYQDIITYYNLFSKSDQNITLSKQEILTLSACLSKSGQIKDLDKLLENHLYKPVSTLHTLLSLPIMSTDYKIQLNNSNLTYNDNLKRALLKHNKYFKVVNICMLALALIQFYYVTTQFFNPLTTFSRVRIIVIAVLIISVILFKLKDLKKIYRLHVKDTQGNFSNSDNLVIKVSNIDKILLIAQAIMIVTTLFGLLMY
ncbi:hypothetical protein [Staphylococcus hyicus]|uniref:hypothetical protein n=1 Tax=Staphylococcus hyicus TaxID=1284 RepID=UPI003132BC93